MANTSDPHRPATGPGLMYRIRLILGKWYVYIGDDTPIGPMRWSECKAHCKTLEDQGYITEQ